MILTLAGMLVVPALVLARPETVSDAGILERQARDTNQPASTRARAIRLWPASLARSRTADLGQWARSQDPGIGSAAVWALGTHMLRRSTVPVPLLAVGFWMTVVCAVVMSLLALVVEGSGWRARTWEKLAATIITRWPRRTHSRAR